MKSLSKKIFLFLILLTFSSIGLSFCSNSAEKSPLGSTSNSHIDAQKSQQSNKPVKIGYFHGGRAQILYRAYIDNYFDNEGIAVALYSNYLNKSRFYKFPKSYEESQKKLFGKDGKETHFGKTRGTEIIKAMERNILEGGTVGESSFVYGVSEGSPIVAVAMLGHGVKDMPGKALLLRKDVTINSPEDFKGKILTTRRAGPGDAIFLREFLENIGLDPEEDLTIIDQVPYHKQIGLIKEKASHGMFGHLRQFLGFLQSGECYIYRKMDWMNPKISHALLVFKKDFIESHPEEVKKIIRAYMKRIKYEDSIPEEEKIKETRDGLQMVFYYQGMSMAKHDYPPFVHLDLLKEAQRLLLKHQFIDEEIDLENFVNNDFVKEIYEELK